MAGNQSIFNATLQTEPMSAGMKTLFEQLDMRCIYAGDRVAELARRVDALQAREHDSSRASSGMFTTHDRSDIIHNFNQLLALHKNTCEDLKYLNSELNYMKLSAIILAAGMFMCILRD